MNVWYMNLKDDRDAENRNSDDELKFRICIEKSILAIGWGFNANFEDWSEYKALADDYYKDDKDDKAYSAAVNGLTKMQKDDLVWLKNPVSHERYLAQIVDDAPSMCCCLKDFDIYSCRKASIIKISPELLKQFDLQGKKDYGRHTIEQVREQPIIDGTIKLFDSIK